MDSQYACRGVGADTNHPLMSNMKVAVQCVARHHRALKVFLMHYSDIWYYRGTWCVGARELYNQTMNLWCPHHASIIEAIYMIRGLKSLSVSMTPSRFISDDASIDGYHIRKSIITSAAMASLRFDLRIRSSKILACIGELSGLTHVCLDIGKSLVTDISAISNMFRLRCLCVDAHDTSIRDIRPISSLYKLEYLKLRLINKKVTDLTPIELLGRLVSLNIDIRNMNIIHMVKTSLMPLLVSVEITNPDPNTVTIHLAEDSIDIMHFIQGWTKRRIFDWPFSDRRVFVHLDGFVKWTKTLNSEAVAYQHVQRITMFLQMFHLDSNVIDDIAPQSFVNSIVDGCLIGRIRKLQVWDYKATVTARMKSAFRCFLEYVVFASSEMEWLHSERNALWLLSNPL